MQSIRIEMTFDVPLQRVWDILIDYEGYARFPKIQAARIVTPGKDHPAGVGAVRELVVDGMTFQERIEEFEPLRGIAYKIIASRPLKMRHDLGRMTLTDEG